MKISFHQISLVVMAVTTSFGCSLSVSAQQLRADNIDEVVKAMSLEEKCI
jgi:beta-glucosidase